MYVLSKRKTTNPNLTFMRMLNWWRHHSNVTVKGCVSALAKQHPGCDKILLPGSYHHEQLRTQVPPPPGVRATVAPEQQTDWGGDISEAQEMEAGSRWGCVITFPSPICTPGCSAGFYHPGSPQQDQKLTQLLLQTRRLNRLFQFWV